MINYEPKTFIQMLKETKKYKDFFFTFEGKISILIAFISCFFIPKYLESLKINEVNNFINNLVWIFIPCLIAYLGVIITGFAFVSGTVSLKATGNIFSKNKINSLISIFFTFYFLGVITSIDIIWFLFLFFISISTFKLNLLIIYFISFITVFINIFIVLYTVGLIDTCINIFFLNYLYNKKEDKDNEK